MELFEFKKFISDDPESNIETTYTKKELFEVMPFLKFALRFDYLVLVDGLTKYEVKRISW